MGQLGPEQMFYQTLHRKKLPIGYLSRLPPSMFTLLDQEPVLDALLHRQPSPIPCRPRRPTPRQMQAFLLTYAPAGFVVSPAYASQPVRAYMRQLLRPYGYREQPDWTAIFC